MLVRYCCRGDYTPTRFVCPSREGVRTLRSFWAECGGLQSGHLVRPFCGDRSLRVGVSLSTQSPRGLRLWREVRAMECELRPSGESTKLFECLAWGPPASINSPTRRSFGIIYGQVPLLSDSVSPSLRLGCSPCHARKCCPQAMRGCQRPMRCCLSRWEGLFMRQSSSGTGRAWVMRSSNAALLRFSTVSSSSSVGR